MDPLVSLLIGSALILFLVFIYLPEKGLIALRRKTNRNKERVLIEDTLKFLFDHEYKGQEASLQATADNLNISIDKASDLIPKLENLELIDSTNKNNIVLTEEGRSYALRVIRIHRIWERYLADETSMSESDWHNDADQIEHKMSLKDADKIAAKIGFPVIDPHGDPIPSSSGELPKYEGRGFDELKSGEVARIIHIEDEPKTIYQQLLALGLFPGMELRMIENSPEKISFEFNGEERILAPGFAANITVKKKSNPKAVTKKNILLSTIQRGDKAKVLGISPACRKQQKRRLMDLGIVPGTEIEVALESVGRNPRAYKILNTLIALRKKHAEMIFVEPIKANLYV